MKRLVRPDKSDTGNESDKPVVTMIHCCPVAPTHRRNQDVKQTLLTYFTYY